MSKIATIEIDGKKLEFPVVEGTENELGIDIKKLRGQTGGDYFRSGIQKYGKL